MTEQHEPDQPGPGGAPPGPWSPPESGRNDPTGGAAPYGASGPWAEHAGYAPLSTPTANMYVPPKNDQMAIWALVMGILGNPLCCTLVAPIGLGLGISSLRRIKRSNGSLEGRGMAIAGIALGGIGTAWLVVFAVLLAAGAWTPGL